MFFQKSQTCLLVLAALVLGACSAKVSGDSPAPSATTFMDPKPTIQGLALDGHWLSACHAKPYENTYRVFDVTFAGNQVTRTEKTYTDANCATTSKDIVRKGIFRFIDKYDETSFGVEYAFDLGQGVTAFPQERVTLKDDTLYLSDFNISVLEDEPLRRAGQSSVTPTPSPVPASTCTSYAGAWNVNGNYFHIIQVGCKEIHWVSEDYSGSDDSESVYVLDGVPHSVDGQMVTSSIKNSNWVLEFTNDNSEKVSMEFSLQTRPCNLMNPDGSTYLTRKTYIDGQYSSCTYWGRQ